MFKIKIANLIVEIDNQYDFVKKHCSDYIVDNSLKSDLCVKASENDIENERKVALKDFSDGYLESVCIYRNIAYALPKFDAFVLHAAVVRVGDFAYAFSAKSGVGKSTHIKLWKKLLGDKVSVINGDKPIIRVIDNKIYAFGTPWCGKEGYNSNESAVFKALCFIERNDKNEIDILNNFDALKLIMNQVVIPKTTENIESFLNLLDCTFKNVDVWKLKCNMDISAAELSYNTMKDGKNK